MPRPEESGRCGSDCAFPEGYNFFVHISTILDMNKIAFECSAFLGKNGSAAPLYICTITLFVREVAIMGKRPRKSEGRHFRGRKPSGFEVCSVQRNAYSCAALCCRGDHGRFRSGAPFSVPSHHRLTLGICSNPSQNSDRCP